MFICDFDFEEKFLSISVHQFFCVFEFAEMEPLSVNEFPFCCDKLAVPFEPPFFASYMCEICLFFT